jgi:hypothetical protein
VFVVQRQMSWINRMLAVLRLEEKCVVELGEKSWALGGSVGSKRCVGHNALMLKMFFSFEEHWGPVVFRPECFGSRRVVPSRVVS